MVHYLRYGAAEGRDPSPRFDTRAYLARNPDVSAEGVNPLLHFIRHGSSEGRQVTTSSDGRAANDPGLPHESMSGDGSDLAEPTIR